MANTRKPELIKSERLKYFAGLAEDLGRPFPENVLQWRTLRTWNSNDYKDRNKQNHNRGQVIVYVSARDVQDRFDAVVGPGNWQVDHKSTQNGQVLTGIGILDPWTGEWIWKWDGGHIGRDRDDAGEKTKGTLSDGLKRAATQWGVGRYLYALPKFQVDYSPEYGGQFDEPDLAVLAPWAIGDGDRPDDWDPNQVIKLFQRDGRRPAGTKPDPSLETLSWNGITVVLDPSMSAEVFWSQVYEITDLAGLDRRKSRESVNDILDDGKNYVDTLREIVTKLQTPKPNGRKRTRKPATRKN